MDGLEGRGRTQKCWTAARCSGAVVLIKSVFDTSATLAKFYFHTSAPSQILQAQLLTRNLSLIPSQNTPDSTPFFCAACWIFSPCSSVPVAKRTGVFG